MITLITQFISTSRNIPPRKSRVFLVRGMDNIWRNKQLFVNLSLVNLEGVLKILIGNEGFNSFGC